MRFESPYLLLLLIPGLAAIVYGIWRDKTKPCCLRFPTLGYVVSAKPPLLSRFYLFPLIMKAIGFLIAILALARPQVKDIEEMAGEGADYMLVLDMSGSMNAVDMPPEQIEEYHRQGREPPNRFETAIETLKKFIENRTYDRVGLIIFSSKAWVKFPLTLDKVAMNRILDGLILDDGVRGPSGQCLNHCTITGEATAIGDALGRAYKRLEKSETKSRNIILITDGDNNAGKAAPEEVARFIAKESQDRPIRIFTFMVGSGKHTFMPARHPFTGQLIIRPDGRRVYERPKEEFPVNPTLLKEIASITGGEYYETPTEEDFRREFERMEKTKFEGIALEEWKEAFIPFVIVAMCFWVLGEVLGLTLFRRWP